MASLLHTHARQPEAVAALTNVVRVPMRTCRVCAARVRGFYFVGAAPHINVSPVSPMSWRRWWMRRPIPSPPRC